MKKDRFFAQVSSMPFGIMRLLSTYSNSVTFDKSDYVEFGVASLEGLGLLNNTDKLKSIKTKSGKD